LLHVCSKDWLRYNSTVTIEELTGLPIRDIEPMDVQEADQPPVEVPYVTISVADADANVPPPVADHEGQGLVPHAQEVALPPEVAELIGSLLGFGVPPPLVKARPASPPMQTYMPPTPMPVTLGPQEKAAISPPPMKVGLPLHPKGGSSSASSAGSTSALAQLDHYHRLLYQGIVAGYIVPKAKSPPEPKNN